MAGVLVFGRGRCVGLPKTQGYYVLNLAELQLLSYRADNNAISMTSCSRMQGGDVAFSDNNHAQITWMSTKQPSV
jgi:hypothetical protein